MPLGMTGAGAKSLRIAMLAPPWIPIPPPAYGGIEEVVALLCEGLVEAGHDVTLFAPPGSESRAAVRPLLDSPYPDEIQIAQFEADHVARAFTEIEAAAEEGRPYDVVHDHTGHVALAMANRLSVPMVHTLHGPFDDRARAFYAAHAHKALIVALSRAQLEAAPDEIVGAAVVPNPLRVEAWPFEPGHDGFLLWIGRMSPDKGPHRAIRVARAAGVPLVLAGPVQPGQEKFFAREVEPHLDDSGVRYVGEAGAEDKRRLYSDAMALLMPIRWPEPFGLVMVEAMACGTPVIAFPEGAAPEVVIDGVSGFLVEDEAAMAAALGRVDELDPARCRAAAERFGVEPVVEAYSEVYRRAAARKPRAAPEGVSAR
jgi:glycosyltransferase involved in cell wall biosynthesis